MWLFRVKASGERVLGNAWHVGIIIWDVNGI